MSACLSFKKAREKLFTSIFTSTGSFSQEVSPINLPGVFSIYLTNVKLSFGVYRNKLSNSLVIEKVKTGLKVYGKNGFKSDHYRLLNKDTAIFLTYFIKFYIFTWLNKMIRKQFYILLLLDRYRPSPGA